MLTLWPNKRESELVSLNVKKFLQQTLAGENKTVLASTRLLCPSKRDEGVG